MLLPSALAPDALGVRRRVVVVVLQVPKRLEVHGVVQRCRSYRSRVIPRHAECRVRTNFVHPRGLFLGRLRRRGRAVDLLAVPSVVSLGGLLVLFFFWSGAVVTTTTITSTTRE